MKSRLLYGVLPFLALYCISCKCSSKTIDCPGYEGTIIKKWFEYSDKQVVSFRTAFGELRTFSLRNTSTTQPYQTTTGWERPGSCSAEQRFESIEKDSLNNSKFGINFFEGEGYSGNVHIWIDKNAIMFNGISENNFQSVKIGFFTAQMFPKGSITLDNLTFSDVIESTRDTTSRKDTGIYKIYIAKQIGLVGYVEYPSLKLWVKQ